MLALANAQCMYRADNVCAAALDTEAKLSDRFQAAAYTCRAGARYTICDLIINSGGGACGILCMVIILKSPADIDPLK